MKLRLPLFGLFLRAALSLFIGIATYLTLYNFSSIQGYPGSAASVLLLVVVLMGAASAWLFYLLLARQIMPIWKRLSWFQRVLLAATSGVLGVLLLAMTTAFEVSPSKIGRAHV